LAVGSVCHRASGDLYARLPHLDLRADYQRTQPIVKLTIELTCLRAVNFVSFTQVFTKPSQDHFRKSNEISAYELRERVLNNTEWTLVESCVRRETLDRVSAMR
jgi:hypothetical protein